MSLVRHAIALLILLWAGHSAATEVTLFSQRQAYYAASGPRVIDNYESPDYQSVMTDAAMSAVLGETDYTTYGGNVVDYNNILPGFGVGRSHAYCSLCYGSFRLSFGDTSLASNGGVFGVGIDITANGGLVLPHVHSATVTFVGGAVATYLLPYVAEAYPARPNPQFWGITADAGIHSIDFVSHASSGPERTFLIIDNLTFSAPVPELSTLALLAAGLCALAAVRSTGKRRS
jgi:hypothetical protein